MLRRLGPFDMVEMYKINDELRNISQVSAACVPATGHSVTRSR